MIATPPRVVTRLTAEPVDCIEVQQTLLRPEDGAIASFVGVIRNHTDGAPVLRLEYDAYAPMARRVLQEIADDVLIRFGLSGLAIVHRTGVVNVGEVGMLVVATAPRRHAALEACAWTVEVVKRDLPVWKREHRADGAVWIGGVPVADAGHEDVNVGRQGAGHVGLVPE